MNTWNAILLQKASLQLGEGALWHPLWQQFVYVDIEGKLLGRIDPKTGSFEIKVMDKHISLALPATGDKLLVALQDSLALYDFDSEQIQELIPLEPDLSHNRSNDGACDASGRLWIGTMHWHAKPDQGTLYRYSGSTLTGMITPTSVSNGIGWSPDNDTLYYIDSHSPYIRAFDFDLQYGTITNQRIIVHIDLPGCVADGMCVDSEGMLWVAIWGGSAVHRYNPDTGALIGVVQVPVPHVTNCALGGTGMQQLFITTARAGLTPEELHQFPLSGSLFIANVDIAGSNPFYFTGTAAS